MAAGHGGKLCSDFISKALPESIFINLKDGNGSISDEILTASFAQVDKTLMQSVHDHFGTILHWPMPKKIRQKAIDSKLQEERIKEVVLRARSGSTALVAVVEPQLIHLANVGDCRAGKPVFVMKYDQTALSHIV